MPTSPVAGARSRRYSRKLCPLASRDHQPWRTRHLAAAYWEHTIRDDRDFAAHLDEPHFNPVKHGLVKHPADWRHSSFRQCVTKGLYPAGWIDGNAEPLETGERH
jgi:REP element-mobilizing transposase RayT